MYFTKITALPAWAMRGIFLDSLSWEPSGDPGDKAHGSAETLLRLEPPGVSQSRASPHLYFSNPPKLLFKCSNQFMAPVASVSDKQIMSVTLDLPVSQDFTVVVYTENLVLW